MTERPVCTLHNIWHECFRFDSDGKQKMSFTTFKRKYRPALISDGVMFQEPSGKFQAMEWRCFASDVRAWRRNGGMSKK